MKSKFYLFSSILQFIVGLAAIIAFVYLAIQGEAMTKWVITLVLAVAFVVMGLLGILDYKKTRGSSRNDLNN